MQQVMHFAQVAKADFQLAGVDVHVHVLRQHVELQRVTGMATGRQAFVVGQTHRMGKLAVANDPAIDRQQLQVALAAR